MRHQGDVAVKRGGRIARKTPLRRKPKKLSLTQVLDRLWSRIVVHDAGYRCSRPACPHAGTIQAHHIVRKGKCTALRWDLKNGQPLCIPCHRWWHNNETEAVTETRELIGHQTFDYLISTLREWRRKDRLRPTFDKKAVLPRLIAECQARGLSTEVA